MSTARILLSACVFTLLGCQEHIPQKGLWTGAMTVRDHKQIPFQLFLDLNPAAPAGYFINGMEQTPIPEIRYQGDSLSLIFSEYGAQMCGTWDGRQWRGRFFRYRSDTTWNDFVSTPKENINDHETSSLPPGLPLVGKFQVYRSSPEGIDSTTTANFWMKKDSIFGTLIAPDGDYGLLAGIQAGYKAALTRFTGWQAFIMELEQQSTHWNGMLFARSGTPMAFTLVPRPAITLEPQPAQRTAMKDQKKSFAFSGITSTGRITNSEDTSLKNKALLIDIMGTWCHNCMDAAPLLQQLYTDFKKDGLEVIGLAFEISDNPETARKNLDLFQKRYGISYPLLFCGSTDKPNADRKLHAQLNDFYAYPTTIFVDKRGVVKKIHVGFHGTGTGEEYQRQVQQYYEAVKQLVK